MMRGVWVLAAVAVLGVFGGAAFADKKELKVTVVFMGDVADEALAGKAPAGGVIVSQKAFDALAAAWKLGEKKADIDFKKDVVVVATTRGSRLNLSANLDTDKGDLRILALATKDLRPGFRYVLGIVPRDGIKTVNGKELPKE